MAEGAIALALDEGRLVARDARATREPLREPLDIPCGHDCVLVDVAEARGEHLVVRLEDGDARDALPFHVLADPQCTALGVEVGLPAEAKLVRAGRSSCSLRGDSHESSSEGLPKHL